jgi:hypothetical protein
MIARDGVIPVQAASGLVNHPYNSWIGEFIELSGFAPGVHLHS